jgi:hypothetical protein
MNKIKILLLIFFSSLALAQPEYEEEEDEFKSLEGKIIRNISIKILDVSGGSVDNGSEIESTWIGDVGNTLHYKTRPWVITNHLLFEEGDTVKPNLLSESERLLRSSGFFLDARIRPSSSDPESEYADVEVIVQDKWTITLHVSYSAEKKTGYLGLKDENILGLGHIAEATITHDEEKAIGTGGKIIYTAANLEGTYIDVSGRLETNKRTDLQAINFSRPFVSTEIPWIGGLDFLWSNSVFEYFQGSGNHTTIPYSLNEQDIWIGRLFPIWTGTKSYLDRTRIFSGARISRTRYSNRPEVTPFQNRIFENSVLYLVGAGILNSRFYKDIYLDKFGTIEDVQIGGIFSVTAGTEKREFNDRWYIGADAAYSRRLAFGYISAAVSLGGFRNRDIWEQNVFSAKLMYHSPLQLLNGWKQRLLVKADYLLGFNRFAGEVVYIDNENGLRGLSRFVVSGTKRTVLNIESRFFSPYSLLGFDLGGVLFADLGLIGGKNLNLVKSRVYQGYGLGIRTENESIADTKFQILLVYNPVNPAPNSKSISILFSSSVNLSPHTFGFLKPSIIGFGNN